MNTDEKTTEPAIEAAEPAIAPSWHAPVKALQDADAKHDARLSSLESGFARLEQKTDALLVVISRIEGMLQSPKFRYVALAVAAALYAWAKTRGVKIPFLEE